MDKDAERCKGGSPTSTLPMPGPAQQTPCLQALRHPPQPPGGQAGGFSETQLNQGETEAWGRTGDPLLQPHDITEQVVLSHLPDVRKLEHLHQHRSSPACRGRASICSLCSTVTRRRRMLLPVSGQEPLSTSPGEQRWAGIDMVESLLGAGCFTYLRLLLLCAPHPNGVKAIAPFRGWAK